MLDIYFLLMKNMCIFVIANFARIFLVCETITMSIVPLLFFKYTTDDVLRV